jgi:hypothetical protein
MKARGATPEEDEARGLITRGVIKDVTPYRDGGGWSVTTDDGLGCGVRDEGVEPKIGDVLTVYGYPFHGQAINGHRDGSRTTRAVRGSPRSARP